MLDPGEYKGTYKLIGGTLCFDFTNTISWRESEKHHEWLDHSDNLVLWAQISKVLKPEELERLNKFFSQKQNWEKYLDQLKVLRKIIYDIFSSIINGSDPNTEDIQNLNSIVGKAMGSLELATSKGKFEWSWSKQLTESDKIQYAIARSASQVLTTQDLTRIKKCPSCQWLYLDMSKNKSRRWCTMEDCGNRNKVNAFNKRSTL